MYERVSTSFFKLAFGACAVQEAKPTAAAIAANNTIFFIYF
jgi:hypothetical protein